MRLYYFTLTIYLLTRLVLSSKLETVFEWKIVNYTPNLSLKHDVKKAVPFDFEKAEDGRVFVTLVGKKEVPVSLTFTKDLAVKSPVLEPYPSLKWFLNSSDCSNITNVRSIKIDKCNRLWVLDTGRLDNDQVCDAKLLVFDLNTDGFLGKHPIPRSITVNKDGKGVLVSPIIDINRSLCDSKTDYTNDITVYIADSEGYALIIWNGSHFKRLEGPEFKYDPSHVKFNISGKSFTLPGGITGMDLMPQSNYLTFSPLASKNLSVFFVNELLDVFDGKSKPKLVNSYNNLKTQTTSLRWTNDGQVMFLGLTDNSIICCGRLDKSVPGNIDTVVIDKEQLQYIISLKTYRSPYDPDKEELWILSVNLQNIITKTLSFEEINYRLLKANVHDLLKDTKCIHK